MDNETAHHKKEGDHLLWSSASAEAWKSQQHGNWKDWEEPGRVSGRDLSQGPGWNLARHAESRFSLSHIRVGMYWLHWMPSDKEHLNKCFLEILSADVGLILFNYASKKSLNMIIDRCFGHLLLHNQVLQGLLT